MNRRTATQLALLAAIWGSSFLLIKLALAGLSPAQIVLGRLGAGAAVLLAVCAARRQRLPRDRVVWAHLALMGLVANVVPFFLFGWAEERITSGLAGLLNGTTPLFTLLFGVAVLPGERASRNRWTGLVLGFVGVVVVVGAGDAVSSVPTTSSVAGQLACLAAAALYGVAFVYTRRFLANRGYAPLVLSTAQLSVATLLMLVLMPFVATTPVALGAGVLTSVLVLGALNTGIAYVLYYRLIAEAGASTASTVTYLVPVVAVVLGVAVLGEPVTWNLFVGGAIVVLGVTLAENRLPASRRERRAVGTR